MSSFQPIRFAVVGLGHFAQAAILPAFANATDHAKLAALVTGDKEKAQQLSEEYAAPAYSYDEYESLLKAGGIDAVYIATPNSLHRQYAEIAAANGVHVLCEKPLAYTSADAQQMVNACAEAKVKLMTAYRLHFEEGNLQAIKAIQSGRIGEPRIFSSIHTMQVKAGNIRIDRELGGGPLEDIGIYCINAARYLFQDEPEEAMALAVYGTDERFHEVPESVAATLRFPEGKLASFTCGFGEAKCSEYQMIGSDGVLEMNPAYTWNDGLTQTIKLAQSEEKCAFEHRDQVAAELVYFAECVRNDNEPEPSGKEGLVDVQIIEALRESYDSRKVVKLALNPPDKRPSTTQSIHRGPPEKPKTVKVQAPGK